jgi:hydroxymethylbilane synthase
MERSILRIGTRGSTLALWQANWVSDRLSERGSKCEIVTIASRADQQPDVSLGSLGVQGVFTKELQKALLDGRIDVAVHSLKDLPTEEIKGLTLAAVPDRESPLDALVSRGGQPLFELPKGAKIGTGSLRRRCQLLHLRSDLQMLDIRGNIDTRLRKLREGEYDGLILAEAGLKRLGLASEISHVLPVEIMLPAVGQGALGLESRANDQRTRETLEQINDFESRQSVLAERNLLDRLRGGCLAPVGAWARIESDGRLRITACVLSGDGSKRISCDIMGNAAEAVQTGRQAAEQLLDQGATELISQSRARN